MRTGVRARVNKWEVPKSPALQQAEGKSSLLPYGSFAELSLVCQLREGTSSQGLL